MSERSIRVAVVGAGYWGPNLIRNCLDMGILDCVCDIDEKALEPVLARDPTITTTTKFEEALARPINAVIIAAPAQFHAGMCLEAIAAGKHVFVEKPLALSVDEGRKIASAADTAGVSVFVGHVLLYHPAIIKMRSLIADGAIGDVWHLRSRRLSLGKLRSHESVWWSFAPHDVALMLAIMGEEPKTAVAAQTCFRDAVISDVAYADFEFSGERSAHVEVCWLDPDKCARLDVFGTKGIATMTDSRNGSTLTLKPIVFSNDDRDLPTVKRGEEQRIEFDSEEPLKVELRAFVNSILTGTDSETNAQQGIAVLKALTMADEAASKRIKLRALA
jgi:UDP-2-acetamido-3-amino-2,3-dideoxy-glucuronate N-acetyltransferase